MVVNTVIALSAAQGTGKSELAAAMADRLKCPHASVSSYIAHRLVAEGLEATPSALRSRGEEFAAQPNELVVRVLGHFGWRRGDGLVFDSVRHAHVLDILREQVAPQEVLHVGLSVPEDVRRTRLLERRREPIDPSNDHHSTEIEVSGLVADAQLQLDGTAEVAELISAVLDELERRRR